MKLPTDDFSDFYTDPETDRQNGDYSSTIMTLGLVCLIISVFLMPVFKSPAPFFFVLVFIILGFTFEGIKENRAVNKNRRKK